VRIVDVLGNLGDLLGGIGVVITIAYPAVQGRRNTRAVKLPATKALSIAIAP
jgi:hypothetical protein